MMSGLISPAGAWSLSLRRDNKGDTLRRRLEGTDVHGLLIDLVAQTAITNPMPQVLLIS
jgi:hypothetical protein